MSVELSVCQPKTDLSYQCSDPEELDAGILEVHVLGGPFDLSR